MNRSASFALLVTALVLFLLSSSAFARVAREKRQETLSPDCYDPPGLNCTWYRECLEKKIPCEGKQGSYAIPYGENYCYRFSSHYYEFSSRGRQWVNAVRRCLQVALVPVLSTTPPCPEIKSKAFQSHVPCYVKPSDDAPGVCDLPVTDFIVISDVLSSAWVSEPLESFKGALGVFKKAEIYIF